MQYNIGIQQVNKHKSETQNSAREERNRDWKRISHLLPHHLLAFDFLIDRYKDNLLFSMAKEKEFLISDGI